MPFDQRVNEFPNADYMAELKIDGLSIFNLCGWCSV